MKTNPAERIALVTGGASGIGLSISAKFIQSGIRTIIVGRDPQKLDAAKTQLGPLCHTIQKDLNELAAIPGLVKDIIATHDRIDILVNNAGINLKKDFLEVTDEEFDAILLTNVRSVFTLTREVVATMLPHGKGNIVNISSMASQYGIPKVIAYSASKAAIEGMTRAMAVELSPLGILVNCIAPGFIATDMSSKALNGDAERKQKVFSRTPPRPPGRSCRDRRSRVLPRLRTGQVRHRGGTARRRRQFHRILTFAI